LTARTALIFGVSGQDGAYLSRLLLEKNYEVHGVSRRDGVAMHTASMQDTDALRNLIDNVRPDEIYNLTGPSSVAQSFAMPQITIDSIVGAHRSLLEALRRSGSRSRLYHAASSECFGDLPRGSAADEHTPFAPRSPYAAAKAEAHRLTIEYRERFGIYAVSGLASNHESPLRGEQFVTKKIVSAAAAAAKGRLEQKLSLGNLSASRDWGYAPEYVDAMWRMLQQDQPADYVVATGESHTVEELAAAAFAAFGLDHREHIVVQPTLLRASDIQYSRGNPARARESLGWEAKTKFAALVRLLVASA
jgi:GDPmannose 4,6-dehydratase